METADERGRGVGVSWSKEFVQLQQEVCRTGVY